MQTVSSGALRGADATPDLEVVRLTIARGGVAVLAEVSFSVAPGTALILRGPNGAGKTTLLRTLAGLQPVLAGTVTPGADSVAYASHADGLKATLTVCENLLFWAKVHGHATIDPALSAFRLQKLKHRAAGTLSAGQKRRLGLARLCVTQRPIWLLDEPTVSLDAATVEMFASVVRAHLAQGGSAVIATHIDLGLGEARVLDVTPFRATQTAQPLNHVTGDFDQDDGEAFL